MRQENRILKRSITELVRHREEQQLTLQKTVAKFSSDQDNQRKFTFCLRQKIVKLSKKIMKLEEVHAVDTTMMELLKSKFQQLQQHVNDVFDVSSDIVSDIETPCPKTPVKRKRQVKTKRRSRKK